MSHRYLTLVSASIISLALIYLFGGSEIWLARSDSGIETHLDSGLFLSSGKKDYSSASSFFFTTFRDSYELNLSKIDSYHTKEDEVFKASVDEWRTPYSDYWFAESIGGTNGPQKVKDGVDYQTYALNIYDKAFYNDEPKAADWEARFHSEKTPDWYGHCNGQSAAAARHQNPGGSEYHVVSRPVGCEQGVDCIEFTPKVIRALLAEIYMNGIARFIGGHRCEMLEGNLRLDIENRPDPENFNACEDPDPGTFHLAVTNWIGRKKQVLIADFNRGREVWNYPVFQYDYSYENGGQRLNAEEAHRATRSTKHASYVFNKSAVSFVVVNMNLVYAEALSLTVIDDKADMPANKKSRRLRYILELDANDNIIGGEWLGWEENGVYQPGSKKNHPDFIWVPFEPGAPSGNRTGGNPFVDNKEVISMWAEARGFSVEDPFNDPKNPNNILSVPKESSIWGGHDSWYSLTLDGQKSGAVFLGKNISLELTPGGRLMKNYEVEVLLNGKSTGISRFVGDPLLLTIAPRAGINFLELRWLINDEIQEGPNRKFRFYAMR